MFNSGKEKISPERLAEAAEWLMEMQESPLDNVQQQQFEQWKNQSPQHNQAWQYAEQLQSSLRNIPVQTHDQILDDQIQQKLSAKFLLIGFLLSSLLATAYIGVQQAWLADYRTAHGTQKQVILEDGTKITLNSKTAIDVDYTAARRTVKLHYGEIFIQTAKENRTNYRPFTVIGQHGSIHALGTQFDVEQLKDRTQVGVIEHAVRIETQQGQQYKLCAGKQAQFTENTISPLQSVDETGYAWRKGLIAADRMPLSVMAQRIEKYYGVHVEIKANPQLIISGTYPTNDFDGLVNALTQAYHLKIEQKMFGYNIVISNDSKNIREN